MTDDREAFVPMPTGTMIRVEGPARLVVPPARGPWTWQARIKPGCYTVHDGDTLVRVSLDLGWHHGHDAVDIRLTSTVGAVNTPEVTGPEKPAGLLVRDAVERWLADPGELWIVSRSINARGDHAKDGRGRTVAEVWSGDKELGTWLLDQGLAKLCDGKGDAVRRVPFTAEELDRIVGKLAPRPYQWGKP